MTKEFKITLFRFKQDKNATLGRFIHKNLKICCTLEPPWRHNQRDNPKTAKNEASCIPEGVYKCIYYSSAKYPEVWEITGVPGREAVLIHNGNYAIQSKACVLVGDRHTEYKGLPMVNNSVTTLKKLRTLDS